MKSIRSRDDEVPPWLGAGEIWLKPIAVQPCVESGSEKVTWPIERRQFGNLVVKGPRVWAEPPFKSAPT